MCTYSQLKKKKKILCNPPRGSKLYASCGIDISKCIEGGSMKLATQVDYIYIYIYVMALVDISMYTMYFFLNLFYLLLFFLKPFFPDLVKVKPLREPEELPIMKCHNKFQIIPISRF